MFNFIALFFLGIDAITYIVTFTLYSCELKNLSLPKLKKQKYEPVNSLFLNVANDFDTPIEITNPKIKRDLELINYFGPHNSNCLVCKKRNMDFYTNSEPNQTLILLNYLKKIKLKVLLFFTTLCAVLIKA